MEDESKALIALNDSPAAESGFEFYADHLHRPNSTVLLVYVVEPHIISSNQTVLHLPEIRQKAAADERRRVEDLQDKYEDKMRTYGIRGRIAVVYCNRNPGKVICQMASSERCSMVVVGQSTKPETKQHQQLGSVCKYIYRNAKCPVVIVPSPDIGTSSPRRGSAVEVPPPDYYTARRFSLAVPMLRRPSDFGLRGPAVGLQLGSSCPDISELGLDGSESMRLRPTRKAITGQVPDVRLVTAQVHDSDDNDDTKL